MPIKSYLAIPKKGMKEKLKRDIKMTQGCEVSLAYNKDVLIIVTETEDSKKDRELFQYLNGMENIQLLTLVSAFSNSTNPNF